MAIFTAIGAIAGITSISSFFSAPGHMILKTPRNAKRKDRK